MSPSRTVRAATPISRLLALVCLLLSGVGLSAAVVSDTFTGGAAGQDLTTRMGEVGATWTKNTTGGTGSVALSGTGSAYGTGSSVLLASGVPPTPNYTVSAQVVNLGGTMTTIGVCGRYSATQMTGYIFRINGAASRVELWQMVNNVPTQLGSTTATITLPAVGSSKLLELQMVGSTITGSYDGTPYFNLTNTVIASTGQAGIRSATTGAATTGLHVDAFTVSAIAPQTPTVTPIANQTINEDAATGVLAFTTSANGQVFSASSSNAALVAPSGLVLGGTGTSRTLTVTPQPNQNGTATITVTVSDGGSPALTTTTSFVLTVTPVNDRPSFVAGSLITRTDTAGAQTIANWATSPVTGPSNESTQTVSYLCSGFDASLFSVAPAISPSGTLTFTPAAGKIGTTTVSVQIQDNGGTANGGVNTSVAQPLSITIQDSVWASLPPRTIYLIATETDYPTATTNVNATDKETTSYAYQWYPGTNQIARKTTTLPVLTATNGPGTATTLVETYDIVGRPQWIQDGDGYVHYRAYDAFTGATTVSVDDVNTATADADITVPAPFTTPTTATNPVAGGTHLKTRVQVDLNGRPVKIIDPKGSITYTVYKDAAHEVRVYPGWNTTTNTPTGPTRLAREDWGRDYREVLTMTATPTLATGAPTGLEAISGVQSLRRELLDGNGRVAFVDTYVDLSGVTYSATTATLGTQRVYVAPPAVASGAYERESLTYLTRGFPNRRVRADGTIEQQVTDTLGRVTQVWRGTDATGWVAGQTTDLTNFKLVSETIYDGGGVGLSLPTTSRAIGDDAAGTARALYTTTYRYDGRGRLTGSLGPDGVLTTLTVDNLNRPTLAKTWAGVATMPAAEPAASALRGQVATAYDALGQVWRTQVTEVDSGDSATPGTVRDVLTGRRWYDRRGNQIKSQDGSAGAFSKSRYDGAGRTVYSWIGMETAETADWASARTSTGDTIAEATQTHYDAASNVAATTRFIRRENDTTTTGDLGVANSQLSTQVRWYDLAHRPIGSADYGRDNATTRYVWSTTGTLIATNGVPTEAVNAPRLPNTSDNYRVTRMTYDAAGRPFQSTDNLGRISETQYDAAGRVVKTIANRVDGVVATGETESDQITTFVQAVGGGLAERRSTVATGTAVSTQVTRYLRTSTLDRSWVTAAILPDSTDTTLAGTDQVETAFDRLGRLRTRTDQRGVVRTFTYDSAGRLASDAATTVPAGVDATVRRLQPVYDDLSRVRSRGSWNAVTGGTQLDDVRRTYDGWGNITATAQAHGGAAVLGTSPTVSYTWNDGGPGTSGGAARSLRLTAVTYPSAGHGAAYRYPTTGLGMALDRPEAITSGGTDIMTAEYLGVATLARQTMARAGLINMQRSSGGSASGYSRYWQVASHGWAVGSTQVDGWNFLYDRGGRITGRKATWLTTRVSRDDAVTYDQLDRVVAFYHGQSDAAGAILPSATRRNWSWTLDQAGNWRTFGQDIDGGAGATAASSQARSHNLANEIDTNDSHSDAAGNSISGSGVDWADPVYDAAGAMTTVPMPGAETTARTLVWDAWGRLVQVRNGATSVWTARYDAEHRLIQSTDVAAAKTSDYYVDESGREVEVRNNSLLAEVYVWGGGDQLLRIGTGTGGSITSYLAVLSDQQGSVTALVTEGTSTVVERYRYDAYGGRTVLLADGVTVVTAAAKTRYGFQGRPFDPTTGLGYFRYRWYHPSLGRFISRDPAGYIDGGSLYQYVKSNPLWWTDPWGLRAEIADDSWLKRFQGNLNAGVRDMLPENVTFGVGLGGTTVVGPGGINAFGQGSVELVFQFGLHDFGDTGVFVVAQAASGPVAAFQDGYGAEGGPQVTLYSDKFEYGGSAGVGIAVVGNVGPLDAQITTNQLADDCPGSINGGVTLSLDTHKAGKVPDVYAGAGLAGQVSWGVTASGAAKELTNLAYEAWYAVW